MKDSRNRTVPIDLDYFKELHRISTNNLIANIKIANRDNRKLIIATHFPTLLDGTSHPKYDHEDTSRKCYFANDFILSYFCDLDITEEDFYKNVLVWISGHTHYSYDLVILFK